MKVSVIIPVYNAGKYLEEAVKSALKQREVEEVVLIEDGSSDNSLDVCKKLESSYEKVKLFRHPNGENRGAGETRNVGLKVAKQEFVSFLDADDFYLENRFKIAKKVFENPNADGVYEAIGVHFESKEEEKKWCLRSGRRMTTISERADPKKLFIFLTLARGGHFSLDGLTIRKKVIDKELGLFNKELKISQDTHFCLKLALVKNLYSGNIDKAVAMRRVHGENRITRVSSDEMIGYQKILWQSLEDHFKNKKVGFSNKSLIFFMTFYYNKLEKISRKKKKIKGNLYFFPVLIIFLFKKPFRGINVFYNTSKFLLKRFF